MSYGTPVSCRFGVPVVLAPTEDRDTGSRLTEAEYAVRMRAQALRDRMEALRRQPPAERDARPQAKVGVHPRASATRVLRCLLERGPLSRPGLEAVLKMDNAQVSRTLRDLRAKGLVTDGGKAPGSRQAREVVLTPEGRAHAEGLA